MRAAALLLVPVAVLAGTSGSGAPSSAIAPAIAPAVAQGTVDTTVVIRASGSALEFVPSRIALKNGLRVRLRFINEGTLPHNIVIPKSEDDISDLAAEAMGADQTGYVPVEMKARMIAFSALAKPTETVDITFTVPPPGEYWYVCLYPGHHANMLGTLRSLR
jgi:plastocyanin